MSEMKNNRFWLNAAEDFRQFRKGNTSMQILIEKYPEFEIKEGWRFYSTIKEAIRLIIPEDCPLPMIPQMVRALKKENDDTNSIHFEIRIAYQPAWEAFTQWTKMQEICDTKKSVVFDISLREPYWRSNKKPCIDIRYLLHEGSHGDCDGYGIEDDTWLVALLNLDGTWFKEWYIEGDY